MNVPPLSELHETARVVSLPLVTRFRGVEHRESLLLQGPEGWTEFSPFVEYDDAEAAAWLTAAIDFGWHPQPAPLRDAVAVNATVPAVAPASVPAVLARFDGCRTAKVKVAERGQTLADDVARVRAVRAAMGPEGRIRLDANGGWNVDEAEHAVHALAEFDLDAFINGAVTATKTVAIAQDRSLGEQIRQAMQDVVDLEQAQSDDKAAGRPSKRRAATADRMAASRSSP